MALRRNPLARRSLPPQPTITWGQWLAIKGAYLAIFFGLSVVTILVLALFGLKLPNAVGFAVIFSAVAAFFVRSLFPLPAEKVLASSSTQPHHSDSFREVVETVVFVVVLVLMLKSFAAEAFVIPTGSMAETLLGYNKLVTCPQCGQEFPVNSSAEADPSEGPPTDVTGCTCPNCRQQITFLRSDEPAREPQTGWVAISNPSINSGDRVLVAKFVYDLLNRLPDRLDVVVFKFPGDDSSFPSKSGPVKKHVPMNYIKRLIGLPGETIAIHRGKLYVLSPEASEEAGLSYHDEEKADGDANKLAQLWQRQHTHHEFAEAIDSKNPNELKPPIRLFRAGKYSIICKKPENLLSMMRLVYDNDHQVGRTCVGAGVRRWRCRSATSGRIACAQAGEDRLHLGRFTEHGLAALPAHPAEARSPGAGKRALDHRLHGLQHLGRRPGPFLRR